MFVRTLMIYAVAGVVVVLLTEALDLTGPAALLLGIAIGCVAFLVFTLTEPS